MAVKGCDSGQQTLMPYEQALNFLLDQARPVGESERLPLQQARGRVLSEPVCSRVDVPPWDNSAMDGYAVNSRDLGQEPKLHVAQRIPAGAAGSELRSGTAARIFTGAPIPPGADAVVTQELCELLENQVLIKQMPGAGDNIRRAGEDMLQGEEILPVGTRLAPQHLGLAASAGVAEVRVRRPLRVAVFTSGDELVMPGGTLGDGQIYNSNHFTLGGLVEGLGCELIQLGRVEDTLEATCDALSRGAEAADLILTSGGVSVGEEDHVKPAVERLGRLELWKIAVRPGKPVAFGQVHGTPFLGAPGNPVSMFVTFVLFARPFILRMQGVTQEVRPITLKAVAAFDKAPTDPRLEFARGRLEIDGRGRAVVRLYPNPSSGVLRSVAWANGLALLPPMTAISQGDTIDFIPFSELLS